ncbi:hypothetical protein J8137_20555, partial [Lactiplantibacillus plantarum]|nr:hypothetical protein [Lactiplantibacillus plantarum]
LTDLIHHSSLIEYLIKKRVQRPSKLTGWGLDTLLFCRDGANEADKTNVLFLNAPFQLVSRPKMAF